MGRQAPHCVSVSKGLDWLPQGGRQHSWAGRSLLAGHIRYVGGRDLEASGRAREGETPIGSSNSQAHGFTAADAGKIVV